VLNEKLVYDLKKFGLNEYEAKAYLTLTIFGPMSASHISNKSGVPQTKVYEIMHSLLSKSLIEMWNSRPIRFKSINISNALKNLIEEKESKLEELRIKSQNIVNKIKTYNFNDNYQMWISKGRKGFFDKMSDILNRTEKFCFTTTDSFIRHPKLDEAFLGAQKNGAEIKILGIKELTEYSKTRAMWYLANDFDVKILPLEVNPVLSLADNKEVCLKINDTESEFIWSNNPSLTNIVRFYFEGLWDRARKI
jgi:sugar-specific transcriptional regulator TrmB